MTRIGIQRWTLLLALAMTGCARDITRRHQVSGAEARAIEFLQREVPAWSRENHCFSCHNNGDAARALYRAKAVGYSVPAEALADTTAWVSQPDRWDHNQGDPGFSDKRLANLQFAASLLAAIETGQLTDKRPLAAAARKVAADQAADGSWPIEARSAVGSPATYGSTLATFTAARILREANTAETWDAREKAEAWLRRAKPDNVPSAATLLFASVRENRRAQARDFVPPATGSLARTSPTNPIPETKSTARACLDLLERAQTSEGGWGPYADSPAEPFDTAVVLLALAEARFLRQAGSTLPPRRKLDEMIARGRAFLIAQQLPDGSWPATTRPPGGDSYAQRISTTGWATLALLVVGGRVEALKR